MGFKCQEQNPPNPLKQDSPVPCMPHEQSPQQPTPGPGPSQHNEPPIPGPSKASKPHEDPFTCKPEPEVAPMQSTKESFTSPATPAFVIIIDDTPVRSLPCPQEHNLLLPPGSKLPSIP
ncbi:hypothetical protein O181_033517 [Austropuccinia psidii MF-1]|uniref:Uncharacterized protein n=1 Tax=Austropuccinia psidii MF-1 TaxID=1389203 RepID=A0A9Q3D4S3_9BASI|nr:hypothetical protein [Austropuccinia psidii MF-1]